MPSCHLSNSLSALFGFCSFSIIVLPHSPCVPHGTPIITSILLSAHIRVMCITKAQIRLTFSDKNRPFCISVYYHFPPHPFTMSFVSLEKVIVIVFFFVPYRSYAQYAVPAPPSSRRIPLHIFSPFPHNQDCTS